MSELSNNPPDDELKNPLYATGVGLVMKGIEKYERDAKRGINISKAETLNEIKIEELTQVKEKKKVVGHSKKKIGSFFENIFKSAQDWISDDIE